MKRFVLAAAVAVAAFSGGCGVENLGIENEIEDLEGKEDGVVRPAAGTYWTDLEAQPGQLTFLVLKTDRTFIGAMVTECAEDGWEPCRPLWVVGTFKYSAGGNKRFIRLLGTSGELRARYQYRLNMNGLSLKDANDRAAQWFELSTTGQISDALCSEVEDCTLQGLPQPKCPGEWKCVRDEEALPDAQRCAYECRSFVTCGGKLGARCAEDEFCDFGGNGCGEWDQTGLCEKRPEICTMEYAPVCGCDDQTHDSACQAHQAGVSVRTAGECEVQNACEGKACGERCDSQPGIPMYCSAQGICAFRVPTCGPACQSDRDCRELVCPFGGFLHETCVDGQCVTPPVTNCRDVECGTNTDCPEGKTCEEFKCVDSGAGTICGGLMGLRCAADEFCDFPNETCGRWDRSGICQKRPTGCREYFEPVCGCDYQTYGNSCEANMAGYDVGSFAACQ